MGSIGETLREARERQGISLHQAEEDTKIRKRYLEALEDGDYDVIPGRVYVKGFLRNYAAYLGLNPDEILMEYKLLTAPAKEETNNADDAPVISTRRRRQRSDKRGYLATVIIAVLAILTVIIYNIIFKKEPANERTDLSRPAVTEQSGQPARENTTGRENGNSAGGAPDTPSSPPAAQQPGSVPPAGGQNGAVNPGTQNPAVQNPGTQNPAGNGTAGQTGQNTPGVNLTIVGKTADCWLKVTVDGVVKFTGIIKPGETRTFSGKGQIFVTYGNAGGVEVIYNGQNLGAPGNINQVIKDREYSAWSSAAPASQGGAG